MNPAHPDDNTRFYLDQPRLSWTDLARIKYIKRLINNSTTRLDKLTQNPGKNKDLIRAEHRLLENAQETLQNLEAKQWPN